jgi:hypothetical protein
MQQTFLFLWNSKVNIGISVLFNFLLQLFFRLNLLRQSSFSLTVQKNKFLPLIFLRTLCLILEIKNQMLILSRSPLERLDDLM